MKTYLKIVTISFLFFNGCKKESDTILTFESLFGKELSCTYKTVKTNLYYLSPHLIGIPIKEEGFEFEYFHSVGSKKETNSIYYESSFRGKSNFQTEQSSSGDLSRKLRVTIKDETLYITAISEIDEKKIPVNPVLYECEIKGTVKFN